MDIKIWLENGERRVFGNVEKTMIFSDRIKIYFKTEKDTIKYNMGDIKQITTFN